jgi:hypothetical protein
MVCISLASFLFSMLTVWTLNVPPSLHSLRLPKNQSYIETLSHVENVDKSYMVQSLQRLIWWISSLFFSFIFCPTHTIFFDNIYLSIFIYSMWPLFDVCLSHSVRLFSRAGFRKLPSWWATAANTAASTNRSGEGGTLSFSLLSCFPFQFFF